MQASAKAAASCRHHLSGGGKVQGCAHAAASAETFEDAFAAAHAEASAEAFTKYCSCSDPNAWTFGEASAFAELTAEAYAVADSASGGSCAPADTSTS